MKLASSLFAALSARSPLPSCRFLRGVPGNANLPIGAGACNSASSTVFGTAPGSLFVHSFHYRKFFGFRSAMQNATPVSPFRMNTCKSVSKQRTLTTFRMNTYEKRGEGGGGTNWNLRDTLAFVIICATWRLYLLWSQSIALTSRRHGGMGADSLLNCVSRVRLSPAPPLTCLCRKNERSYRPAQ